MLLFVPQVGILRCQKALALVSQPPDLAVSQEHIAAAGKHGNVLTAQHFQHLHHHPRPQLHVTVHRCDALDLQLRRDGGKRHGHHIVNIRADICVQYDPFHLR